MPNDMQWLDPNELQAWRTFLRAQSTVTTTLDRELTRDHHLGLADYEVLSHLREASNHSLRMTELARSVLLSPSGLTRRLDGLVKNGYVERKPCPSDGRGLLAVLTEKGEAKTQEMTPTHARAVREHFTACMSSQEVGDLTRVLTPIAEQDPANPDCVSTTPANGQAADIRDNSSGTSSTATSQLSATATAGR